MKAVRVLITRLWVTHTAVHTCQKTGGRLTPALPGCVLLEFKVRGVAAHLPFPWGHIPVTCVPRIAIASLMSRMALGRIRKGDCHTSRKRPFFRARDDPF